MPRLNVIGCWENNGFARLVWRVTAWAHLPPVNANGAIRVAAGGGPRRRVAVHVKPQQAGVERVEDDSTCVVYEKM